MLDVTIARIYRETLATTEQKEVGASDLTEQIKQIVKRYAADRRPGARRVSFGGKEHDQPSYGRTRPRRRYGGSGAPSPREP
jgi:hypothetical protein